MVAKGLNRIKVMLVEKKRTNKWLAEAIPICDIPDYVSMKIEKSVEDNSKFDKKSIKTVLVKTANFGELAKDLISFF